MRLGISTAHCGQLARPAAVRAIASAAEQVGYSSVWALEGPVDPLAVAAATGAVTSRLRLGAALVVGQQHDPQLLARSLASLDTLTEGRLTVSLGPAAPHRQDGDEALAQTLAALPPRRPPILVGTLAPELIALRADGWDATGLDLDAVAAGWDRIRERATAAGRDPDGLHLLLRAAIAVSDGPRESDRPRFQGSPEQVANDIEEAGRVGVQEVVLGLIGNPGLDEALDAYARVAEAASVRPAA